MRYSVITILPKCCALCMKRSASSGLLEREDAIDHGPQLIGGDGAVHVFKHGDRSDENSAHAESLDTDEADRYGAGHAGEHADDGDLSGRPDRVHGTGESFAAANFENDVDAFAAGEAQHFFVPIGMSSCS